jgi:hypothetical protein
VRGEALEQAVTAATEARSDEEAVKRRRGAATRAQTASAAAGVAHPPRTPELLGDTKRVAADHYVYALTDYREVDRTLALERLLAEVT